MFGFSTKYGFEQSYRLLWIQDDELVSTKEVVHISKDMLYCVSIVVVNDCFYSFYTEHKITSLKVLKYSVDDENDFSIHENSSASIEFQSSNRYKGFDFTTTGIFDCIRVEQGFETSI